MVNNISRDTNIRKLIKRALNRFIGALIIISIILFIPAGTIYYWNAWLFIIALFVPVLLVMTYLVKNDPELLEKRMNTKEKE